MGKQPILNDNIRVTDLTSYDLLAAKIITYFTFRENPEKLFELFAEIARPTDASQGKDEGYRPLLYH